MQFIHYLDDYLMGHHQLQQCTHAFFTMQAMSNEISLPLSPEKLVPPTQCLNFLGLGIDTIGMVITVPEDKKTDIIACLQSALHAKKLRAKQLQSLAGKLNFITKAVPPGRTFSARIYWAFKNVQPNWHISVTKEMRKDLQMWIVFLQEFGGCTPILMEIQPTVQICMDALANPDLGWGGLVSSGVDVPKMGQELPGPKQTLN